MPTATSGVLARFPLLVPVRNSCASYGASAAEGMQAENKHVGTKYKGVRWGRKPCTRAGWSCKCDDAGKFSGLTGQASSAATNCGAGTYLLAVTEQRLEMMDNLLMRDDDDHRQQRQGRRERWSAAHDAGVEGWLVALGLADKIQDFRCLRARARSLVV